MYPWGHVAVGYLLYLAVARARGWAAPRGRTLLVLLVATQAPDLVDKPLAYYGVLVSGRSLAHSLFTAALVVAAVVWLGRRYEAPRVATAWVVGHLSHLAADAVGPALAGRWADLGFLLYPVIPPTPSPADAVPPWIRILHAGLGPAQLAQVALLVLAAALFVWSDRRLVRRAESDGGNERDGGRENDGR